MHLPLRASAILVPALLLAACATSTPVAAPTETAAPTMTASPSDAPAPSTIDWWTTDEVHDLGGGWTASRCEGDAPLICLEQDGETIGAVEFMAFPIADPPTDDPVAWLREKADDFAATLVADRAIGCGDDYVLEFRESGQIGGDGVTWITYSFTGTTAEGKVVEQGIAHLAVDGHVQTVLGANAYDPGGCMDTEGSLWTVADLSASRGALDRLAGASIPGSFEVGVGLVHGRVTEVDGDTIVVDTVEFLSGEEAVRAAVADGEIAEGDDLPNDFYVRDRVADSLVLTVGSSSTLSLVDCTQGCTTVDADLRAWLADQSGAYGGASALYAFNLAQGELAHVAEQYLP